jgi:2-methylisocitrate lyase-like PEP mutase family enzyme
MSDRASAEAFRALHREGSPLVMANAWDPGSARLLAAAGFHALATTSSGYAASLGRLDYAVGREETLQHAASLVASVDVPVSADLEDCFPADPGGVAETVRLAGEKGLAGCSIEDWDPRAGALLETAAAAERVASAAEQARSGPNRVLLTARAENHLRSNPDADDTIARLQAYERAGADVLYAPGMDDAGDIRRLVEAVGVPVNVLIRPRTPPLAELAELGVARVSVGGALAFLAYGAATDAARKLLEEGRYDFLEGAGPGAALARAAFAAGP